MNCMNMKHFSAVFLTVLPAVLHAAQQTHFQDVRRGGRSEFAGHHPARRVEAAGSDHGALQCAPSECWCVSFGNCASEDGSCFPDECYDQELCPGGGYSCAGIAGSGSDSGSGMGTGSAGSGSGSGGGTDAMGCLPSQCWCVSFGNCHSEDGSCLPDECFDQELCPGGGYMCAGIAGSGSGSGSGGGSGMVAGGFAAVSCAGSGSGSGCGRGTGNGEGFGDFAAVRSGTGMVAGGFAAVSCAGSGSGSGCGRGTGNGEGFGDFAAVRSGTGMKKEGVAAETATADTAHGGSKKEAGTTIGLAAVVAVAVVAAIAMIGIMAWKMRTDHRVTVPVDIELEQP